MTDHMDMQCFSESGTWHKPPGAVSVEVVIKGGDGELDRPGRPHHSGYQGRVGH